MADGRRIERQSYSMTYDDLKKALHKAIMKAYRRGQESVSKQRAVNHIIRDLDDPNYIAEVPSSHIPATSENILHKEMSVSEIHNQKQMNAEAKLGKRPDKPSTKTSFESNSGKMRPLKNFMMMKKEKRNETKHDRCVRKVKEKNPNIRNPHAVCVAAGVRPSKWKK